MSCAARRRRRSGARHRSSEDGSTPPPAALPAEPPAKRQRTAAAGLGSRHVTPQPLAAQQQAQQQVQAQQAQQQAQQQGPPALSSAQELANVSAVFSRIAATGDQVRPWPAPANALPARPCAACCSPGGPAQPCAQAEEPWARQRRPRAAPAAAAPLRLPHALPAPCPCPQAQIDKAVDILLSTKPGVVPDLIIANLAWLPAQRPADEVPGLRSGVEVLAEILTRRQQATAAAAAPKPQPLGPAAAPEGAAPQPPGKPQPPAGPPPPAPRPVRKQHASWPPPLEPAEARGLRLAAVKRVLAARHVTAPNFRELLLARLATKVGGDAAADDDDDC